MAEKSSMLEFAEHVLAVANNNNKKLTNLHLQKIMYFALKFAIDENLYNREELESIYDQPFCVWQYGPVVPQVYREFKIFGSEVILGDFEENNERFGRMNGFIEGLSEINPFYLVGVSHKIPFWQTHKNDIMGATSQSEYGLEDI